MRTGKNVGEDGVRSNCPGRTIRVVSLFPGRGRAAPEDKLKACIDPDFQRGELCGKNAGRFAPPGVSCDRNALNGLTKKRRAA